MTSAPMSSVVRRGIEQQAIGRNRGGRKRPKEAFLHRGRRLIEPARDRIDGCRRDHDGRVPGKAFGDLDGPLTFLTSRVESSARLAERERIANGLHTRASRFPQCSSQRAPFEAQPISALHRIDVLIRRSRLHQPQSRLHAVEQFVDEEFLAGLRCLALDKIPHERHPRRPAPVERCVHQTECTRARPLWRRLARGNRVRPRIDDHHRAAERHSPQAAAIALAQHLGFPEILLRPLLIDLPRHGQDAGDGHEHDREKPHSAAQHADPSTVDCRTDPSDAEIDKR
jgi:hypothetical protein